MSRRFLGLIVALIALTQSESATIAQTASPTAVACQTSPTVPEPAFPATASPAASPAASPVKAATHAVEPAVATQIEQLVQALAACLSEGNAAGVADIATADYLGDAFGGGERLSRNDYLALAATAPVIPVRVVAISEPAYTGMRTAAADVELVAGNQLRLERWTFVFRLNNANDPSTPVAATAAAQGHWLAHHTEPLNPQSPSGATQVGTTLNEYTISLEDRTLRGPNIIFESRNAGAEPHELLVLRLTDGATTDALLRPTSESFPAGIDVVGQLTLLPGEQHDLVLVDLASGEYSIVCLFPDTSGVPHLAFGQETTFTVQ
jgi:hypothetical protein